jgi:hypothetical protein
MKIRMEVVWIMTLLGSHMTLFSLWSVLLVIFLILGPSRAVRGGGDGCREGVLAFFYGGLKNVVDLEIKS